MKTVLILMASYNGEKYIKKQIDSIINQTNIQNHQIHIILVKVIIDT